VTLAAARVTLKQHRFEIGVAVVAAIVATLIGLSIALRISALAVPTSCLTAAVESQDSSGVPSSCLALVREGAGILGETFLTGEGTVALSIMGVLPFLVGLLGGVPIVAAEIEARTAQTAWSLYGSRSRWLGRQVTPILLVLGGAMAMAALAAVPVADASVAWGQSASSLIGLHGPLALLRAFAAFGIGLAVGAVVGRALPAFLIASALSFLLLVGTGLAREVWAKSLEPRALAQLSPATGEFEIPPRAVTTGWGVLTPEGTLLSAAKGREIATAAGVPPAAEYDTQDGPALEWYAANGYKLVPVGVSDETALGWSAYDGLTFAAVGAVGVLAALIVVQRTRPS
jgi:hypothetical protein